MSAVAELNLPDARGHFGPYGGRYVPETLMHPLQELEAEYFRAQQDPAFQRELAYYLKEFCGRPTPLYFAERLTRELGGAKIYLKREDLNHTGAHKINNAIGQVLLARRMGKTRVIAETGAGQHGVATATVAAMFGLKCVVYMGAVDCQRQELNVYRMQMLGAEVVPVQAGQKTLKEAVNEAMRDWVTHLRSTHYILGTAYGAHPYPVMVRNFQRVIGDEARRADSGKRTPVARPAPGLRRRRFQCHRAVLSLPRRRGRGHGGGGGGRTGHPTRSARGAVSGRLAGVLQGTRSYILQDDVGQIQLTHSVSAGLDYAAVGPEHAWLHDQKRVEYTYATDDQALAAFMKLARLEGIIPALESAHAVAECLLRAPALRPDQLIIVNLSGRGDKDVAQVAAKVGLQRPE